VLSGAFGLWAYRDIPAAEIETRYASPASRFLNVDGVRIHYRDEGPVDSSQLPMVLVHANWGSLVDWDEWVDVISRDRRVVRFDMTSHGLTGTDPSGDYSLERTDWLMQQFVTGLALERFDLAGTSLGATIALRYAAAQPGKVNRLMLVSLGGMNPRSRGRTEPMELPAVSKLLTLITPRAVSAAVLRSAYGNEELLTDEVIDRWYDMLLREGNREAQLARMSQYISGDFDAIISSVAVPTLIMWGARNRQVPVENAAELASLLTSAPWVHSIIYPDVGHAPVLEIGRQSALDALAYLEDELPPPP
jgi:pimeloyl-ACP methyl ester carboxylesterase